MPMGVVPGTPSTSACYHHASSVDLASSTGRSACQFGSVTWDAWLGGSASVHVVTLTHSASVSSGMCDGSLGADRRAMRKKGKPIPCPTHSSDHLLCKQWLRAHKLLI